MPLIIILLFYPIITFRKYSHKTISIYLQDLKVETSPGWLVPMKTTQQLGPNTYVELKEYFRDSYTSALESGNKEYYAVFKIYIDNNEQVELFFFTSRDKSQLYFVKELKNQLQKILNKENAGI